MIQSAVNNIYLELCDVGICQYMTEIANLIEKIQAFPIEIIDSSLFVAKLLTRFVMLMDTFCEV